MVKKLVQKDLLKGTREFEIVDDSINVVIKAPFKKAETLTVMLSVLNPEPVISQSLVEFTSRVNNEPLVSFFSGKPNASEFNAFVTLLKQLSQNEYKSFAGLKTDEPSPLEGNSYDEPPEFESTESTSAARKWKPVKIAEVEESIRMLRDYVGGEEITPLVTALEALLVEPENDGIRARVYNEFEALGPGQGAVLTYAPYVGILMSGDPYDHF